MAHIHLDTPEFLSIARGEAPRPRHLDRCAECAETLKAIADWTKHTGGEPPSRFGEGNDPVRRPSR